MSKRTLRRAAERQARKSERNLQLTVQPAMPAPTVIAELTPEPESSDEDLNPRLDAHSPSVAQLNANRENAKLSCGPVTPEGKATVAQNRRTHGLTGRFTVLPWENAAGFQALAQSIYAEHNPETDTEQRLADSLIQHYWLKERAIQLQEQLIANSEDPAEVDGKKLSLFLRYQTTHERSYYKAERELQNIRKAKRKEQIGFESQNRQQEAHEARIRLTHARAQNLEIDTLCRQTMEAPLPGNTRLSFAEVAKACSTGIATAVYQNQFKTAA